MTTQTIRQWARENGLHVAERGMIPRDILEAYKSAEGIVTSYPGITPAVIHADLALQESPSEPTSTPTPLHLVGTRPSLFAVVQTEPPKATAPQKSFSAWMDLRDLLAEAIATARSPKEAAESILLAGWLQQEDRSGF